MILLKKTYMKKILLIPLFMMNFNSYQEPPTVIITGSDFQGSSHEQSKNNVINIIYQIQEDNYDINGVIFCGDYTAKLNNNPQDSEEGITYLKQSIEENNITLNDNNLVLVQGNHDPIGTNGLSSFGNNDDKLNRYGCFVINEDNYMWMQGKNTSNGNILTTDDELEIKKTSLALEEYLNKKEEQNFYKPIFIASHLGLHYSLRCYEDGDTHYAKYIFDVLNNHPNLNIIYLFGHNHSHGWDNYLGGSSIFLTKGDEIYLSTLENNYACYKDTLNFTYMNAGYTGYYTTDNPLDGACDILSMSLFEIYDNEVKIKRYSEDGQVNLKEVGVLNTRKGSEEKLSLYPLNEDCVDEYILKLNRTNEKNNLPLILSIIGGSLFLIVIVFLVIKKRYCNKIKNN